MSHGVNATPIFVFSNQQNHYKLVLAYVIIMQNQLKKDGMAGKYKATGNHINSTSLVVRVTEVSMQCHYFILTPISIQVQRQCMLWLPYFDTDDKFHDNDVVIATTAE